MKNLLITGDWHITDKQPANRIDNYEEALFAKLKFIFEIAKEHDACILQPGDFFDAFSPSYKLFTKIVMLLNEYKEVELFCCYGQHDLRYREKSNTALKALSHSSNNLTIVDNFGAIAKGYPIYGVSYNEDIDDGKLDNAGINILIIHKMIVQDKLWERQTDYVKADKLLKESNFQIIVSGDNHQRFIQESKGKVLFNMGSLMRRNTTQLDHKPALVLYQDGKWETIEITIEPAEKVFAMEKIESEKEKSKELELFISGLSENKEMSLDFQANLNAYLKDNKIDREIKNILEENMI
jgi:predicted phosphodiesterase